MNKETLTALKESIKKWKGILRGKKVDGGTNNCPLCKLYWSNDCYGCPVYKLSDKQGCENTPYEDWADHHGAEEHQSYNSRGYVSMKIECDDCRDIAKDELSFLKSLLPEEEREE